MEACADKLVCPLCGIVCEYDHVVYAHKEFWDRKLPTEVLPSTPEDFNRRFAAIGLRVYAAVSKDVL